MPHWHDDYFRLIIFFLKADMEKYSENWEVTLFKRHFDL